MPNRLIHSRSTYNQQHAHDPVDWFEWSEEAFSEAKRTNRPILLSIGYSSCHWCHVMGHESFEDAEVAEVLNRAFVSIKVDREEHPLVDEAYMTAVQLSSGRGGWPMTLFLTPDREPFFAGTYFPKDDREERIGFLTLARRVEELWTSQPGELQKSAAEFSAALTGALSQTIPSHNQPLDINFLTEAVEEILRDYDSHYGGFGGAPKFPPHTAIALLLNFGQSELAPLDPARRAIDAAAFTLQQICLGGIHDHVGGGFHRYSVDEIWHLPHFEKMLLDNALMIGNLALAAKLVPSWGPLFKPAMDQCVAWLGAEMRLPNGLYASALDADSDGHEGKFYVWHAAELKQILGADYSEFASSFTIEEDGNFYDEATRVLTGENVLHAQSMEHTMSHERKAKLLEARSKRNRPQRDDKAIIATNALLALNLHRAGIETGQALFHSLVTLLDGRLGRAIYDSEVVGSPTLEDVAALAWAESEICPESTTFREQLREYKNLVGPGYTSSSSNGEFFFARTVPVFDSPAPSGNGIVGLALVSSHPQKVAQLIHDVSGWMVKASHSTETLLLGLLRSLELTPLPPIFSALDSGQILVQPRANTTVELLNFDEFSVQGAVISTPTMLSIPPGMEAIQYRICDEWMCGVLRSWAP